MTLRLASEDDIDDSMAANAEREEEPVDIGQARRRAKRQGGATHWRIVEADGPPPAHLTSPEVKIRTCRRCGASGEHLVLWADPASSHPERVLCPTCQGRATADLIGYQPRGES